LPYAGALHRAIARWQRRSIAGAALHQFRGDAVTLVLDLRAPGKSAYLLRGAGHVLHDALRTACTDEQVAAAFRAVAPARPASESDSDRSILAAARALGAEVLPEPGADVALERFVEELDARRLVLPIDRRLVALAVDCESPLARLQLLASDLLPELPLARPAARAA